MSTTRNVNFAVISCNLGVPTACLLKTHHNTEKSTNTTQEGKNLRYLKARRQLVNNKHSPYNCQQLQGVKQQLITMKLVKILTFYNNNLDEK
jgi:hypothetical protein